MRDAKDGPSLVACLGVAAWLAACLWYPLTDTDIWWHLAAADWMRAHRTVPRADPFSLSSMGAAWTDLQWGFQVAAGAAWRTGGAAALIGAKCAAVIGAIFLVLRPHLSGRTWPWLLPLAAAGGCLVRFQLDARPLALTLLGLGIQYAAVTAFLRGRLRGPIWILVPVQAALANVQGLYPLGLALVGSLTAGEALARRRKGFAPAYPDARPVPLRPLAVSLALMVPAGLATPYGWDGFRLPLALLARIAPDASNIFSREIAENRPFTDLFASDPVTASACLAWAAVVAWTFRRGRMPAGHALLCLAFGALGLAAQRNLPLALLAGLAAAGRNLEVSPVRPTGKAEPGRAALAGWAALAAVALVFAPRLRAAWAYELPGSLVTPFRVPGEAVDLLAARPLPGPIFNELRFGGYLEFRLHPRPAFVDGRMILRSGAFYRDFLDAVDHPELFPEYRARYGFTHALLPIAEDGRFRPLAASLLGAGWDLLYCDGAAVLLADPALAAGGMPLDSLGAGHPLPEAVRKRFGPNPRLFRLASACAAAFLLEAGKERAASDLAAFAVRTRNLDASP